ncbi:hypothetical protein CEXT_208901 [Caerostris extrusa]|uniref:Uncharacterized protein n=1 Tax=Caerostris extrusa TaxID=172846 RepID=A0AAV4MW37_CAEEX|nr:hypothetical protein CEXT_208901 [Caerostris extrusa]
MRPLYLPFRSRLRFTIGRALEFWRSRDSKGRFWFWLGTKRPRHLWWFVIQIDAVDDNNRGISGRSWPLEYSSKPILTAPYLKISYIP